MASKKPSALGRGLGALLGDDVLKPESGGALYLPISQVESCAGQPRKHFDQEKLEELAALLGGGVGATRSAVDAGWISYPHQIGQTGITVRPRLYLAFGVSGLVQHTVGMSSSGVVVAVNTERNAPIFACADYGIVADWEETIDEWIQYVKERKQQA